MVVISWIRLPLFPYNKISDTSIEFSSKKVGLNHY